MPAALKLSVFGFLTVLVAGAVALIALYGPAIILDMAAGAAAFICL